MSILSRDPSVPPMWSNDFNAWAVQSKDRRRRKAAWLVLVKKDAHFNPAIWIWFRGLAIGMSVVAVGWRRLTLPCLQKLSFSPNCSWRGLNVPPARPKNGSSRLAISALPNWKLVWLKTLKTSARNCSAAVATTKNDRKRPRIWNAIKSNWLRHWRQGSGGSSDWQFVLTPSKNANINLVAENKLSQTTSGKHFAKWWHHDESPQTTGRRS